MLWSHASIPRGCIALSTHAIVITDKVIKLTIVIIIRNHDRILEFLFIQEKTKETRACGWKVSNDDVTTNSFQLVFNPMGCGLH